jgi:hypothetical protein
MSNDTLDLDALEAALARLVNAPFYPESSEDVQAVCGAAPALLARARESATKDARIAALTAALRDALDLAEGPAIIEAATSDLESVARLRALLGTEGANG